jgi:hypothetical protein
MKYHQIFLQFPLDDLKRPKTIRIQNSNKEYLPIGTSIGCEDFNPSGIRKLANVSATNCVQISNSGKHLSTAKYSIHDANPSLSP